jgi:hypothetical protein
MVSQGSFLQHGVRRGASKGDVSASNCDSLFWKACGSKPFGLMRMDVHVSQLLLTVGQLTSLGRVETLIDFFGMAVPEGGAVLRTDNPA